MKISSKLHEVTNKGNSASDMKQVCNFLNQHNRDVLIGFDRMRYQNIQALNIQCSNTT